MGKKQCNYECPHCKELDTLLISNWTIDMATGRTDYSGGYICTKCGGKVEAVAKGGKNFHVEPKARKVAVC